MDNFYPFDPSDSKIFLPQTKNLSWWMKILYVYFQSRPPTRRSKPTQRVRARAHGSSPRIQLPEETLEPPEAHPPSPCQMAHEVRESCGWSGFGEEIRPGARQNWTLDPDLGPRTPLQTTKMPHFDPFWPPFWPLLTSKFLALARNWAAFVQSGLQNGGQVWTSKRRFWPLKPDFDLLEDQIPNTWHMILTTFCTFRRLKIPHFWSAALTPQTRISDFDQFNRYDLLRSWFRSSEINQKGVKNPDPPPPPPVHMVGGVVNGCSNYWIFFLIRCAQVVKSTSDTPFRPPLTPPYERWYRVNWGNHALRR